MFWELTYIWDYGNNKFSCQQSESLWESWKTTCYQKWYNSPLSAYMSSISLEVTRRCCTHKWMVIISHSPNSVQCSFVICDGFWKNPNPNSSRTKIGDTSHCYMLSQKIETDSACQCWTRIPSKSIDTTIKSGRKVSSDLNKRPYFAIRCVGWSKMQRYWQSQRVKARTRDVRQLPQFGSFRNRETFRLKLWSFHACGVSKEGPPPAAEGR